MTSPAPAATIVIPAYEAGESVRAALGSALAQTLTDIEVLVVDDGSSIDPVPQDLTEDPRVVVDRRPRNTGYAGVTNHANARARGRWIFYLDADDLVEPDALELLVAAGEEYDADAVWCPQMCVREGTEIGLLEWDPPGAVSDAREALRRVVGHQLVGSQHILLRNPASDAPEGMTYSDLVFVMRHLARSERVAYVGRPLYRCTIHPRSATGASWVLVKLSPALHRAAYRSYDRLKSHGLRPGR